MLKKRLFAGVVLAAAGLAAWLCVRDAWRPGEGKPPADRALESGAPRAGETPAPEPAAPLVRQEESVEPAPVVSGKVRALVDCRAIEGAVVFGLDRALQRAFSTRSGRDGAFAAPEGFRGMVVAEAEGFGRGRDGFYFDAGALPAGMFDVRLSEAVTIAGTVRWTTGAPVAGAAVEVRDELARELGPFRAITATDGAYQINGFPALTFGRADWRVLRPDGEVAAFGSLPALLQTPVHRLDVELGAGVALAVEVRDARDAAPLGGALAVVCEARVGHPAWLRAEHLLLLKHARCDAAGRVVLPDLPRGSFMLLCAASGFGSVAEPFEVHQAEGSLTRTVSLLPGCTVAGRVLRGDGSAAPSCPVEVVDAAHLDPTALWGGNADLHPFAAASAAPWGTNPFRRRLGTGEDGSFRFEGLPATPHLFVRANHGALPGAQAGPFALQPGDRIENLELRLPRLIRVEGFVSTEDGMPAPAGSRVEVYLPPGGVAVAEDGAYAIEVAEQAETLLCARAEGFLQATLVLAPPLPDVVHHDFVLRRGRQLSGRLVNAEGAPVPDVQVCLFGAVPQEVVRTAVWVWPAGCKASVDAATTGADGRFACRRVPDFPVMVEAWGPSGAKARLGPVPPDSTDLLLVLVPARTGAEPALPGILRGRVARRAGGEPVTDFRLFVLRGGEGAASPADVTLDNDRFEARVAPGLVRVQVEAPGFAPAATDLVAVRAESVTDLPPVLLEEGCAAEVLVEDAAGQPLAATIVRLEPADRPGADGGAGRPAGATTRSDGIARFEHLAAGVYSIAVLHPELAAPLGSSLQVVGRGDARTSVRCVPGARLTVTVAGTMSSAYFRVETLTGRTVRAGTLDGRRAEDSTVLPAGAYRLFVERGGCWLAVRPISLAAGQAQRCPIGAE